MKYCSNCGHALEFKIPAGDNRLRGVCQQCDFIHYVNPKIVAGTIPIWGDSVLLCKRAIEPRKGYWTLPAGFMEMQETASEAAMRETWEEAEARVAIKNLYSMISVPHIGQVHIFFMAELVEENFGVGEESLETKLFAEREIPWDEIAFPTVLKTLRLFFADRKEGTFQMHIHDIIYDKQKY